MIISNEPGYYKTGAYGIRIENLVLVNELAKVAGGERETMSFETLTLVPIDRRLVVAEMLSPAELDWLNAYHRRVREIIGPELGPADRDWLEKATAAIRMPVVIPEIAQRVSVPRGPASASGRSMPQVPDASASGMTGDDGRRIYPNRSTLCRNASSASSTAMIVSALRKP